MIFFVFVFLFFCFLVFLFFWGIHYSSKLEQLHSSLNSFKMTQIASGEYFLAECNYFIVSFISNKYNCELQKLMPK